MKVEISIEDETIKDAIITATEQGIGYWARAWRQRGDRFAVVLRDQHDGRCLYRFRGRDLERGLGIMAARYPHLFEQFLGEGAAPDAWASDALIQCAAFGELVYG